MGFMAVRKPKKPLSIRSQQKALRKLVLSTPIEEILPNKNKQAVENLRRAGLLSEPNSNSESEPKSKSKR